MHYLKGKMTEAVNKDELKIHRVRMHCIGTLEHALSLSCLSHDRSQPMTLFIGINS